MSAVNDDAMALVQLAFQRVRAGDAPGLEALLDQGVPPDVLNEKGDSLLMLASYHGHPGATSLLLARGADPALRNDRGQAPLDGVAFKGDLVVARILLAHGAAVDAASADGKTALMYAAMFDRVEIVKELLERRADPARRDASGASARDLATAMGATRAAALLTAEESARGAAAGG